MIYDISKSLRDLISCLSQTKELHREMIIDIEKNSIKLPEMQN